MIKRASRTVIIATWLIGLIIVIPTPRAFACTCAPPPPPSVAWSETSAVFSGRVINVVFSSPSAGGTSSSLDPITVTLEMLRSWKGPSSREIQVSTANSSASCGYTFRRTEEYLVYAQGNSGELQVSLCSRTAPLADAADDLAFLSPAAPTLATPQSGTQLSAMMVSLGWQLTAGVTQVQVQVTPALNDGPGVNAIQNTTDSLNLPSPPEWYGLLPGMTYSWRVRTTAKTEGAGENDALWGSWSSVWTFRTPPTSSDGMEPVMPPAGTTLERTDPAVLQWRHPDPALYYFEVQVSGDAGFPSGPGAPSFVWSNLVHGGVSNPPNSWITPRLDAGRTYYWRVRPRVQGDGTPVAWSPTFTFKTVTTLMIASVPADTPPYSRDEWGH
jgi:hypothetical protein